MALMQCPECGGTVSDAASACPHCGFPLEQPAVGNAGQIFRTVSQMRAGGSSPELSAELSAEIREALKTAGFGDAGLGNISFGEPVVTTRVFSTTTTPPPAAVVSPLVGVYGYDYRSKLNLFGLPLLAMSKGYDPATGRKRVARGMIAVGDVAVGGLAIGGAAFGLFAVGGVAVGVVSLGGLAIGLLLAIGGGSVGFFAVGGGAFGYYAFGGLSLGVHTLSQHLTTHTGR